ncbi:MAG: MYG1 family protein [Candidatus Taylorbacteria bacterium]|nr:MYG1 family protein [Candidatus Taylorbacteria bacterium]
MDKTVVIATHDGVFHADDAFAVATLFIMLDASLVPTTVVRTRDQELIRKADFVVDVGGVYNAEESRFDHHQEGGAGERGNHVPYAAFGLVWKAFGARITKSEAVADSVDRILVSPVDADDSGVAIYTKTVSDTAPYTVSDLVHDMRPTWQEDVSMMDARFLDAVGTARTILERTIAHARGQVEAQEKVVALYEATTDKRVIVLDTFFPHEEVLSTLPEPLFSIYPRHDGKWSVKAIREKGALFTNLKSLPKDWAGKRDAELARITEVPDAVFCHNARFVVVAQSKEGALALAEKALNS